MERRKVDLWDFVPGIGAIWGGNLNQFETAELAHHRWIEQVVEDVIMRAEWRAGATFGNRADLKDIVRVGMAMPSFLEHGL